MQNKQPGPRRLQHARGVFHIYCTSPWGLAAALLLPLYHLRSRMELQVWFPTGTWCCHRKEKEWWPNRTVVLQVSVSEGAWRGFSHSTVQHSHIAQTEVSELEPEGQQMTVSSGTGSTDGVKKSQRTLTAAGHAGNWTHSGCAPAVQYP